MYVCIYIYIYYFNDSSLGDRQFVWSDIKVDWSTTLQMVGIIPRKISVRNLLVIVSLHVVHLSQNLVAEKN